MWIRHRFELAVTLAAILVAGSASADPPAPPRAPSGSLDAYRERFQLGMQEYRIGAVANAIAYWEQVYLAIGPREGYRVAYDLGVAYLQIGDATLAAEHLQSFLDQVAMRRESGEVVSAMVNKEEGDAQARMTNLTATKARIRIDADPSLRVRIDDGRARPAGFVAWVAPGEHIVAFSTSPDAPFAETHSVNAHAGELVDVTRTPPPAPTSDPVLEAATPPPSPLQRPTERAAAPEAPVPLVRPMAIETPVETRVRHPISQPIILASGALTAVAVAVAVPLGIHAFSLHSRFVGENESAGSISASDRQNFDASRNAYDVALGSAIGLGVVTTALTTWYFAGSSRESIPVEPVVAHERGGASVALRGHF